MENVTPETNETRVEQSVEVATAQAEVNPTSVEITSAETVDSKPSAGARVLRHFNAGNIAIMAILTAISFVLYMFVKFPLPFMFPSFLDMQISDLPALLGGFALGPVEGCLIIIIKCCIKMPFTSTACIGELGDIAIGVANVLPASLIYRFYKNRKGAIWGLLAGMVTAVCVALLMNWLVLIPFYANQFGMGAIVGMMQSLYPDITADTVYNYYLPLAVIPFNILRCLVCGLVTYFTYQPLSKILHWEVKSKKKRAVVDDDTIIVDATVDDTIVDNTTVDDKQTNE